jgi:hypothetical protein
LDGSRYSAAHCDVLSLAELRATLADDVPDVIVLATRGPSAWIILEKVIKEMARRPVVVTGLPGISIPAQRLGVVYRSGADLFILHSTREVREYEAIAADTPLAGRFALANLPFSAPEVASSEHRDEVIFAAQALVPRLPEERRQVIGALIDLARDKPHLQVVLKVRATKGEAQTHFEAHSYPDLLEAMLTEGVDLPDNLVVSAKSMRAHLARAIGLATVSSTAAIEAVAADVPVLILDDFGVSDEMINTVFVDSNLVGSLSDLRSATFFTPHDQWRSDNYFHASESDDVVPRLRGLISERRASGLPPVELIVRDELRPLQRVHARLSAGNRARDRWGARLTARAMRYMRGVRWRLNVQRRKAL